VQRCEVAGLHSHHDPLLPTAGRKKTPRKSPRRRMFDMCTPRCVVTVILHVLAVISLGVR
jgi:hypothetical protein